MTAVIARHRRPRPLRASAVVLAGAVIGAVLVAVTFTQLRTGERAERASLPTPDADTGLAAYAAALAPLAVEGGQIVAEGLRPGLADIAQGAYPDDVLVRMASGWVASISDVRDEVAALHAAGDAATVAVQVERALAVYIRTAEALLDAARATGGERTVLIDRAAALGRIADRLYDAATAALPDFSPSLPTPTPSERP